MWYIFTREYYSVIRKNEKMSFASTWMDLEIVKLSADFFNGHYVLGLQTEA